MRHLRRAGTREVVLGVVSVAVLGFAIWYLVTHMSGRDSAPPGTIGYYCPRCQYHFKLTNEQYEKMWDAHEWKSFDRGVVLYKCIKCGQITAQRAEDNEIPAPIPDDATKGS